MRLWPWIVGGIGVGVGVWWLTRNPATYRVVVMRVTDDGVEVTHQETTRTQIEAIHLGERLAGLMGKKSAVYVATLGTVIAAWGWKDGSPQRLLDKNLAAFQASIILLNSVSGRLGLKDKYATLPLSGRR